jgi:hypothetical protein
MLKYKLTDQNNQTYNNTQWGKNVSIKMIVAKKVVAPN